MDPNTPTPDAAPEPDLLAGMEAAMASDAPVEPPTEPSAEPSPPPEEAPKEEAPKDPPAAEAAPAEAPQPEAPAVEDATEQELRELGIKSEKASARFREMAAEIRELAPVREALKAAGVEKLAELPQIVQRVKDADFLIQQVVETGATSEQYGKTLEYLSLVNRAATGDRQAMEQAWAMIEPEVQLLAQLLGKEVPGLVDPLAAHPDLREAVERGDIPRQHALEVAQARQQQALWQEQQRQTQTRQQQAAQQQQAVVQARQALNDLGAELMQADPDRYQAVAPQLVAKVREITQAYPPSQWVEQTLKAYALLKPPAPKPQVGPVPLRPAGGRPAVEPATFDSPEAALEYALQQSR